MELETKKAIFAIVLQAPGNVCAEISWLKTRIFAETGDFSSPMMPELAVLAWLDKSFLPEGGQVKADRIPTIKANNPLLLGNMVIQERSLFLAGKRESDAMLKDLIMDSVVFPHSVPCFSGSPPFPSGYGFFLARLSDEIAAQKVKNLLMDELNTAKGNPLKTRAIKTAKIMQMELQGDPLSFTRFEWKLVDLARVVFPRAHA